MIETYGKSTALDGTEFRFTDMRESRRDAAAKAESHDNSIIAAREQQLGRPLTVREQLAPTTREETPPPREPAAEGRKEDSPKRECIKLPYPLTAPARKLTPEEESAKQMFQETFLAAALAQHAKKAQQ